MSWQLNFSGTKAGLKEKHDTAIKAVNTDGGDAKFLWPLLAGIISKPTIRDSQTVEVSVSAGEIASTGRSAFTVNIVII